MREVLRWGLPAAAALAGVFLVVDTAFFSSNLTKIAEGGYVPLLFILAAALHSVVLHSSPFAAWHWSGCCSPETRPESD
jgi:K+ transporter